MRGRARRRSKRPCFFQRDSDGRPRNSADNWKNSFGDDQVGPFSAFPAAAALVAGGVHPRAREPGDPLLSVRPRGLAAVAEYLCDGILRRGGGVVAPVGAAAFAPALESPFADVRQRR